MFDRLRKILRKRAAKNEVRSSSERNEAAKNSDLEAVIRELKTILEHLVRASDQGSPENQQKRSLERSGVRAVWAAAIVGIIAIVVGSIDSSHQYRMLRKQDDLIAAQNRPWLKPYVRFLGLRFTDAGDAEITVYVDFINVGKATAQNIQSRIVGAVMTKATAIYSTNEERAQCKLANKDAVHSPGVILFPGEEAPEIIGGRGVTRVYVSNSTFKEAWPNPRDLVFKVTGCLGYALWGDSERGKTGFSYNVSRRLESGHEAGFAPAKSEMIPSEQVIFEPDSFTSGFIK